MSRQDIAEVASAFANTNTGGTLIFGVDNASRMVVGIERLQEFTSYLTQALRDTAKPAIQHVATPLQVSVYACQQIGLCVPA